MAIAYVSVMKHDADMIPTGVPDDAGHLMSDEALDAYLMALPPCPGLPSTDEEIKAAEARARADFAAGRYYDHKVVGEWLKTWGKPDFVPFKEWIVIRNG